MKSPTQKERILQLLHESDWVPNYELNEICFRYGARMFELKKEGHVILKRHEKKKSGLVYYKLQQPVPVQGRLL